MLELATRTICRAETEVITVQLQLDSREVENRPLARRHGPFVRGFDGGGGGRRGGVQGWSGRRHGSCVEGYRKREDGVLLWYDCGVS